MLELTSLPLAFIAGMLSLLSPCVWPLIPMTLAVAAGKGRMGMISMGLGLSLSFALAGSVLTFLLVSLNLDPETFRHFSALLLLILGSVLISRYLTERSSYWLSRLLSRSGAGSLQLDWLGPFGTGLLTGIIWLPCVGPTLGAAIALAANGQSLPIAFLVMASYGLGTALVLILVGLTSTRLLRRSTAGVLQGGGWVRYVLGGTMLLLAMLVLSGADKTLEAWAAVWLPQWSFDW